MTTHDTSMMEVADIVYTLEDGVISDITENVASDGEVADA